MEQMIENIKSKPNDYKLCKFCNHINWYENEECVSCGESEFKELGKDIISAVEDELKYWVNEEHYSEEEAHKIFIEV